MALESATYIESLDAANPAFNDPKAQGDDHLRLLKSTLKATFPGLAGAFARVQAKSGGYTVIATDNTTLFRCSSALTLSLTAAATLGNKHSFAVYAEGGDVTIDPNAAETINEVATSIVPQGSFALVWCDGVEFIAAILPSASASGAVQLITGNTTFVLGTFSGLKEVTATAILTLPAANAALVGKSMVVHSSTETSVTIAPAGTNTIEGLNVAFRLPSYSTLELTCISATAFILTLRPQYAVGDIIPRSVAQTLQGFIPADDAAVSRTTYGGLFAVNGTTWGVGDGSTTFVPLVLRGRGLIGSGTGATLSARAVGQTMGAEVHALTTAEMPIHSHTMSQPEAATDQPNAGSTNFSRANNQFGTQTPSTNNAGGGSSHNNMQPSSVAAFYIKT